MENKEYKRNFDKRFQLTFSTLSTKHELEEIAKKEGRSLSNMINYILNKYIEEHKQGQ